MIKRKILENNKKGFALLFSVLVSSLLLTIGLSIFSLTLKELAISTSARQSIYAFFAADSGREYVLFSDLKPEGAGNLSFSPSFSVQDGTVIDSSVDISGVVLTNNSEGPNFEVTVTKKRSADISQPIITTIQSKGYDSKADDRVERAIEQIY